MASVTNAKMAASMCPAPPISQISSGHHAYASASAGALPRRFKIPTNPANVRHSKANMVSFIAMMFVAKNVASQ